VKVKLRALGSQKVVHDGVGEEENKVISVTGDPPSANLFFVRGVLPRSTGSLYHVSPHRTYYETYVSHATLLTPCPHPASSSRLTAQRRPPQGRPSTGYLLPGPSPLQRCCRLCYRGRQHRDQLIDNSNWLRWRQGIH